MVIKTPIKLTKSQQIKMIAARNVYEASLKEARRQYQEAIDKAWEIFNTTSAQIRKEK